MLDFAADDDEKEYILYIRYYDQRLQEVASWDQDPSMHRLLWLRQW